MTISEFNFSAHSPQFVGGLGWFCVQPASDSGSGGDAMRPAYLSIQEDRQQYIVV
jgi:hypothetical protein